MSWNCSLSQKPCWFSLCFLEKPQPPLLSLPTRSTLGIFWSRSPLLSVIPRPEAAFLRRILWGWESSAVEKGGETDKRLRGGAAAALQPELVWTVAKTGVKLVNFEQNHRRASSHKLCPSRLTPSPLRPWGVGLNIFCNLCGMVIHPAVNGIVHSPFWELPIRISPDPKKSTSASWTSLFPPG